ncbi:MAG: hypothetical protein JO186_13210 [Actinobacteria bacterium]|nr:hypothetical protein [Actinomycetota bacterium]
MSGGRRVLLVAVAVVVAAGIGAGVYLATSGSSKTSGPPPLPDPLTALHGHDLLAPECTPVSGTRWYGPGTTLITSKLYEVFAIHMSCNLARTWTQELAAHKVPILKTGNISPIKGPKGWNCSGFPDKYNHAYGGGCRKGQQAFGWNWNVVNRRVVFVPSADGGLTEQKLAGSDAEIITRPLPNGSYQLEVMNTSGVGYLDSFTWAPPGGLEVTSIGHVNGAKCSLANNTISCVANLRPPVCICSGSGGDLIIDIALKPRSPTPGQKGVTYGTAGSDFEITKMTPVPYLIPGTPKEAQRRGGV